MLTLSEIIEQARQAQINHNQLHDVQLEIDWREDEEGQQLELKPPS